MPRHQSVGSHVNVVNMRNEYLNFTVIVYLPWCCTIKNDIDLILILIQYFAECFFSFFSFPDLRGKLAHGWEKRERKTDILYDIRHTIWRDGRRRDGAFISEPWLETDKWYKAIDGDEFGAGEQRRDPRCPFDHKAEKTQGSKIDLIPCRWRRSAFPESHNSPAVSQSLQKTDLQLDSDPPPTSILCVFHKG